MRESAKPLGSFAANNADGAALGNAESSWDCKTEPSKELLRTAQDLIAFDTTSRNSNLGLIETVRDDLHPCGFQSFLTYDASASKTNLLATLPADDGCLTGGICLSGHVDTVPVDGQEWTSDPFCGVVRGGRLYGRGACDMKGFVAVAITVAKSFANRPRPLPIHLALSYDEELGCLGAPDLVREMISRGIVPGGCVIGEPSGMNIICGHKGANVGRVTLQGIACHSSETPKGVNAIEHAAHFILHIKEVAEHFRLEGPFDEGFAIPFTTLQTGKISGGISVNTVPADCQLDLEFRNIPEMSADVIRRDLNIYIENTVAPAMRTEYGRGNANIEWLARVPAFEADETAAFTKLVRRIVGDHETRKVAYGTEAGIFAQADIPAIVCGPGSIAQAHIADEFVELEQLALCERYLNTLITQFQH